MTVQEIVALAEERGLAIEVDHAGNPRIRGPKQEVTPALLAVLKLYREDIVAGLPRQPPPPELYRPREWLWRTGYVEGEEPGDPTWNQPNGHKQTSGWWRFKGERLWKRVPGKEPCVPPAGEEVAGA